MSGDPCCAVHGGTCPCVDDMGEQCIVKLQRSVWDRMAEMSMHSKDDWSQQRRDFEQMYCDPFEKSDNIITDDQTGSVIGIIGQSSTSPIRNVIRDYIGDDTLAGFFADCLEVLARKGPDYAGKDGARSQQFSDAARELGVPVEKVWGSYFHKHYAAIMKFCRDGNTSSEPLRGRLIDAVNYLALLLTITEERKEGPK